MTNFPTLWSPTSESISRSGLARFIELARKSSAAVPDADTSAFHDWTVAHPHEFWGTLWDFLGIVHETPFTSVLKKGASIKEAEWFSGARLNFAENLLRFRDSQPAIIFRAEAQHRIELSYAEVFSKVTSLATHLRSCGIMPGDRIAACLPNMPEALIGMLATSAIGAIWSSCSPDFGVDGIVDRFEQIEPRILIACDGYFFKGKEISCLQKIEVALSKLPSVEQLITVRYIGKENDLNNGLYFDQLVAAPPTQFSFEQLPAEHPLYIMFSSGTTGKPKCIVHGAIGTLIEQRKELELHCDLQREDRIFYQTTCGWMMWNWLASSLASGATIILFDGAPFHEEGRILFRIAEEERITIFGSNAKFLALLEKSAVKPGAEFNLKSIRSLLSTGSVLAPESFDYVYRDIKSDLQLSSISGGTDILGCFALGSPALPVRRGVLQTRSFGLAVEVFDSQGRSIVGEHGELVCTQPFPSMPIGFWNDADGERFHQAYFEHFPGVWTHGDYVELLADGGMVFHGRSDATLNPGGVRIGTAEIYHQVEKVTGVLESLVVARRSVADEEIVLFVVMKRDQPFNPQIESAIRSIIRQNLTAFHVPHHIFAVPDLPRTRSGKTMELAVRDIISGKQIGNREALANPESLAIFEQIARHFADGKFV